MPDPTSAGRRDRAAAPTICVVLAVALTLAVALLGASRLDPAGGYDGVAFLRYAQVVKAGDGLPTKAQSYEYASPPAYPWEAAVLARGGLGWRGGQALSALWAALLVVVGWLLARELWPGRPWLQAAAAVATAAIPILIRLGTMFHPEMQFACLAALALLLVIRGGRRGWPPLDGALLGLTLGVAALTRQTAVAVAVALAIAVVLAGRRRALRFLAAAAAALVLVAGPWWGWQTHVYGNPLQSNLDRYLIPGGQPRSFYLSAPLRALVVHPYRPDFAGQLWPQFHADLWSDWFGGQHELWSKQPGSATRVFLSSQSVLGLLLTPLALGGLLAFGVPALSRLARARGDRRDVVFGTFLVLAAVTWAAFLVQLIRFPQQGGDPIKSSYMLFLAPVFAISGLAAARWLWRRGRGWRWALAAWAGLYAVSYAGFLATSWPR
jgi:4-amino-4-deoxy-L-arabinose transferase-like glycosyltransferase